MTLEEAKELLIEELKDSDPLDETFYWSMYRIGAKERTEDEEEVLSDGMYWERLNLEDDGKLKSMEDISLEFIGYVATEKFENHGEAIDRIVDILTDYNTGAEERFSKTFEIAEELGFDFRYLNSTILATLFASKTWLDENMSTKSAQMLIEKLNGQIETE